MTRRQLLKNFGFGLAGMLALPLFGKPGKASEPVLPMTDHFGNPWPAGVRLEPIKTFGSPSDMLGTPSRYASWHGSRESYRAYLCDLRAQQLQLMRDGALMNKYPPVIG